MNCGRSSSVEWKLPKLQRRVRFPSPAPPPPGRAPGGFVMPVRGELHYMRVRYAGDTRPEGFMQCPCRHGGRTPPTRPGAISVGATKLAQHGSSTGSPAKKLAQQAQKRRKLGFLSPLGKLFRARDSNFSRSKRSRTQRRIHRVHMKPPAPLLTSGSELLKPTTPPHTCPSRPMKPPSPLQALNTRKTAIFPAQRCHRFQASAHTRSQRCHRFHRSEAMH